MLNLPIILLENFRSGIWVFLKFPMGTVKLRYVAKIIFFILGEKYLISSGRVPCVQALCRFDSWRNVKFRAMDPTKLNLTQPKDICISRGLATSENQV